VGLAFLLSQAGAHAADEFAKRLRKRDLTPQDAGVLRMVGSNPGMSQQALSDLLGLFPSRLVTLLDGLEKARLIERRDGPDRRTYHLHLSKAGQRALKAVGTESGLLEEQLIAALTASERDALHRYLKKIIAQQRVTPGVHPAYRQLGKARRS
jgi:DNA-binding MarR family transcriptional regulator